MGRNKCPTLIETAQDGTSNNAVGSPLLAVALGSIFLIELSKKIAFLFLLEISPIVYSNMKNAHFKNHNIRDVLK